MADGTPVGVAALRNLKTAIPHVIAVVRTGDDELGQVLGAEGAEVVVSEHAWLGMGHSLASAVAATQQTEGWVVALGDMPRIRPHTILRVADELRRTSKIVVPMYNSERGHPVAFPSSLRGALLALTGDAGARAFIQGNAEWVTRIAVSDPGIVRDVDTLQDLAAIDTPQS